MLEKKIISQTKELDIESLLEGKTIQQVINKLEQLKVEQGADAKFSIYIGDGYVDLDLEQEPRLETDEEYKKRVEETKHHLKRDMIYCLQHIENYKKKLEQYTKELESLEE